MGGDKDWQPKEADSKARGYADLVKTGSEDSLAQLRTGLMNEAAEMPRVEFLDLLLRIDSANAADRKTNQLLPDVSIFMDLNEDWRRNSDTSEALSTIQLSVSRPGKWFGRYWQESEVLYSNKSQTPGKKTGAQTLP